MDIASGEMMVQLHPVPRECSSTVEYLGWQCILKLIWGG